ncbi:SDR family NAD(P)-dependent oxidoreductase, partial [Actibacterium sp.]|uniref:SDR family NAD(P)-dependent oxidoreductase n=1 Tax=Actibacterium sp. TaxID=1872125 RepID=UPI00356AD18E
MSERTAIVTGGAQGIGLGITRKLLEKGHRVAVWDRDSKALAALPEVLGSASDRVFGQEVDVTDGAGVTDAVAALSDRWSAPDTLVNNAGIAR